MTAAFFTYPAAVQPFFDLCSRFTGNLQQLQQLQYQELPPTPTYTPPSAGFCFMTDLTATKSCLEPQICMVCGQSADGYHFGVMVCAACGAFFRRSVVEQKVYSCTGCNSGMAPSTSRGWARERDERASLKTPGVCRYCRFHRCLAVGMKPEEVQAKRTLGYGRLRSLKFSRSSSSFEDLIARRRDIAARRQSITSEPVAFTVEDIRKSMESEYGLFYSFIMQSPIMVELLNDASPIPSPDMILVIERSAHHHETIRELFLFSFLFETVKSTAMQGGIQSDSVTLPTGVRLPLDHEPLERLYASDPAIGDPACLARLSTDFLFSVVRVVARSLQALHADQNELAWLYIIFVASAVIPVGRRSAFRDELLAAVSLADDHAIERQGQLLLLLSPMMSSLDHLREFLHVSDLAGADLTRHIAHLPDVKPSVVKSE